MNISTDLADISPDFDKSAGGYEWWYFDGMSTKNEYSFVIIFYHVNPFSTNYINELHSNNIDGLVHPGISVSVYHKSKPVYYSFLEFEKDNFSWSEEELRLKVGTETVQYKATEHSLSFKIELNQKLASGHSLQGVISGKGGLTPTSLIKSRSGDNHLWNLLLPSLTFKAELVIDGVEGRDSLTFEGNGYHDHNNGQEPMKESFHDWYWGRYHFKEKTLVYYLMNKHQGQQFEGWLIDRDNQTVLAHFEEAELDSYTRNWFGLKSARKIELKNDKAAITIQCRDKVDDGPFYQRFSGDSILNYEDKLYGTQGISEYIYPRNIYEKKFWPMVHMRLRYMNEKPHWVQKSRLLYPWTW